jgi:hypothetical protein
MRSDGRTRELPSGKSHEPPELTSMVEVHTTATQRLVIPGIVKNGLVVPQSVARAYADGFGGTVENSCAAARRRACDEGR